MRVRDVMTSGVYRCRPERPLADAVHLMWKYDLGALPVVNEEDQPIGVVTDRDVCMTAFERDVPLRELAVRDAMSQSVFTCSEHDRLEDAERVMRDWQVYRLPVVDARGKLTGILSLTDLARARSGDWYQRGQEHLRSDIVRTLVAVCGRRHDEDHDRPRP